MLSNSVKMTKIVRNMSELQQTVCSNVILSLVHLLVFYCINFLLMHERGYH